MTSVPPPPPVEPQPWGAPPEYQPTLQAEYASWGARLGAYLIDGLIVGAMGIPALIAIFAGPTTTELCSVSTDGSINFNGVDNAICEVPSGGTWAIFGLLVVTAFVGGLVYRAKTDGVTGQTIGRKAVGIKVVDINTGQPTGAGRAIARQFAYAISAIPCYIGFLFPLWDKQKQALHDKVLSTVVIRA